MEPAEEYRATVQLAVKIWLRLQRKALENTPWLKALLALQEQIKRATR